MIKIAIATYLGCHPAPGWEKMTDLRLQLIVDHIRDAEKFATLPAVDAKLAGEIRTTAHALRKYVVCEPHI